ncbi:MAG: hypothetical protein NUV78_02230 [Candidatus Zambryskibacteria bacterium]|nr:hypothetical protein [Candidatus Zambryskibacteria bacterium]
MKYQIEYCPNSDVIQIHVDQRLIRGTILCFEHYDIGRHTKKEFKTEAMDADVLVRFCRAVSEFDGMEQQISFGRYEIQLQKASMFRWEQLVPHILEALRIFVARDENLEESVPPKRPTARMLRELRKQGCDV